MAPVECWALCAYAYPAPPTALQPASAEKDEFGRKELQCKEANLCITCFDSYKSYPPGGSILFTYINPACSHISAHLAAISSLLIIMETLPPPPSWLRDTPSPDSRSVSPCLYQWQWQLATLLLHFKATHHPANSAQLKHEYNIFSQLNTVFKYLKVDAKLSVVNS